MDENFKQGEKIPELFKNAKWDLVFGSPPESNGDAILDNHPVTFYPTISLVNHRGIFHKVNVSSSKAEFEIETLAEQRLND